jgi:hypothetical protein
VLIPGEKRQKEKEKLFPLGIQVCPSKNGLREKANKKIKGRKGEGTWKGGSKRFWRSA